MKKINLILIGLLITTRLLSQTKENIVSLTTTGTGKTIEEAKNNALRSAIEQAFGAFISSKTELINDKLVKDEITSVSTGNIESYSILSQVELPDNNFALTLTSILSVSRLTSYCQSKGIQVEYKGSLFATNIKLQKLNEDAEQKAILGICTVSKELLNKSLDFSVRTSDPVLESGSSDTYEIIYTVECQTNQNYQVFNDYYLKSIFGINMSIDEVIEYKKLNKPVYSFILDWSFSNFQKDKKRKKTENDYIGSTTINLRSKESAIILQNFFIRMNAFVYDFMLENDLEKIKVNRNYLYQSGKDIICTSENEIDCWKSTNIGGELLYLYGNPISRLNGLINFQFINFRGGLESSFHVLNEYILCEQGLDFFDINQEESWKFTANKLQKPLNHNAIKNNYNYCITLFSYPSAFNTWNSEEYFGNFYLNSLSYIEHSIKKKYTLDQISKISIVKVVAL